MAGLIQAGQAATSALDRAGIRAETNQLATEFKGRGLSPQELEHATNQAYWFTVASGVVFALVWFVLARMVYVARPSGRVISTVLGLVYVFAFVFSGAGSGVDTAYGVVLSLLAIAVIYLLWRREVTAWVTSTAPTVDGNEMDAHPADGTADSRADGPSDTSGDDVRNAARDATRDVMGDDMSGHTGDGTSARLASRPDAGESPHRH